MASIQHLIIFYHFLFRTRSGGFLLIYTETMYYCAPYAGCVITIALKYVYYRFYIGIFVGEAA